MKKTVAILLVFALAFSLCGCKPYKHKTNNNAVKAAEKLGSSQIQLDCVAKSYNMDLELDTYNDVLSGTVTVTVNNRAAYSFNELYFNLYSMAMTDDAEITAAKDLTNGTELNVAPEGSNCTYRVELANPLTSHNNITLELTFSESLSYDNYKFTLLSVGKGKVYSLMMCFPMLTAHYDAEWKLHDFCADGEMACGQKTNIKATLKCPEKYKVLASGHQSSKNGVTTIDAENTSELAIIVSDVMEIDTFKRDGITYNMCRIPYTSFNSANLERYFEIAQADATACFDLFSSKIGKYIYDEIDIIPCPRSSAVSGTEMPGLITYSLISLDDVMFNQSEAESFVHKTVSHEIANQWFYAGVVNDQYAEPWLDESFASFLENYYCENNSDFDDKTRIYINLSTDQYTTDDYAYVYINGARFLNELKDAMGKDLFFEMLSDWYKANNKGIVRGRGFVNHVMKYTQPRIDESNTRTDNDKISISSIFNLQIFTSKPKSALTESVEKIINKYIRSTNL